MDGYRILAVEQPTSKDSLGYPGWVRRGALVRGIAIADQYIVVMVARAAMRSESGLASPTVTWLYMDSRLPAVGGAAGWVQVRLPNDRLGWVVGTEVRLTADPDTPVYTDQLLETAAALLGTPYQWGGTTPEAFDCSGFTYRILHAHGITIARDSKDQAAMGGRPVSRENLLPGDLVFTADSEGSMVSHVAIYAGADQIVDCGLGGATRRSWDDVLDGRAWAGARTYAR